MEMTLAIAAHDVQCDVRRDARTVGDGLEL
jgi:hypothetical protein